MNQKKYYSAQESAYKKIKENGEVGWQKKTMNEFRCEDTERIIRSFIKSWSINTVGKRALDVGTGTGQSAHILFDLGFSVTGIDVCPTAIEHAKEIAQLENKKIDFKVMDAIDVNQKFDLIYDSHCLHCVVFTEDRNSFYQKIKNSLNHNGYFIVDTMVLENSNSKLNVDNLYFDEEFILWHKVKNLDFSGTKEINGEYYCPQRRIYPMQTVMEELQQQGFEILESVLESQHDGDASMLRTLCALKNY